MMLKIANLCISYGKFTALRDVSFSCAGAGKLHGVIGPNGAGKTTLMDALSGRTIPTSGSIEFDGVDITRKAVAWRRLNGLARSFQKTSIFPSFTVREQLQLVAHRLADPGAMEIAGVMGLTPLLEAKAGAISYGDQRRVDIALALIGKPKMILLDEPAAGLSGAETTTLFEHLAELVKVRNVAAMLVEHDVEAVFGFCDEITVLDLGRHLITAAPTVVRADPAVINAYLGSEA
jgi:branched-chain amino acid transport system ATP-binding protein